MKRKFTLFSGLLLTLSTQIIGQTSTVYLTTSGGLYTSEKWVSVTDGPNGTGNVIWDQGAGTYGANAGLLTDEPITINNGTTYYINCYDRYADGWDGTTYELRDVSGGGGTLIANNGGTSPDDGTDNDASSSFGDTQANELESSEMFSYTPPTCPEPMNFFVTHINADSVYISWTAGGSETEWVIEYGPAPLTPGMGDGTVITYSNDANDTITGLVLSQTYDFYLVGVCSASDSSNWVSASIPMPLSNDNACDAIELSVDGITRSFTSNGATSETNEPQNGSGGSSVWFYYVAPNNYGTTVSLCGSSFDTKVYGYSRIDCGDFNSYTELGYNDDYCNIQSQIEICSLTGDTVFVKVDGFSGESGDFVITLTSTEFEAGIGSTVDVCTGDSLNLWTALSGQSDNLGTWGYASNPNGVYNDSLAIISYMSIVDNEFYYIKGNSCAFDTATVTVNALNPEASGTAITPFETCNSDVFLPDGLEGNIESGGTWSDDSNTGLLAGPNDNVFVAGDAANGTYSFTYTVDNGACPPSSTTLSVTITDCAGIDENNVDFTLYPNPNEGNFFILSEVPGKNNVRITDISGKIVYNSTVSLNGDVPFEIALDNVEAGMYLINISSPNYSSVINVVIK